MLEKINVDEMADALRGFTEAPASLNFYVVTGKGFNCQITLRDDDEFRLMTRFANLSQYLLDKGASPKPVGQQPNGRQETSAPVSPASIPQVAAGVPAPAVAPATSANPTTKIMTVDTIHKSMTDNGKPYLRVKGAPFSKWGVKAWPEAVEGLLNLESLEVGKEYEPPASMKRAECELTESNNPRKVLRFMPS